MIEKYVIEAEVFCKTSMFPGGRWIPYIREFTSEDLCVGFISRLKKEPDIEQVKIKSFRRMTYTDIKFPDIIEHE